jgi:hypothetical protein
MKMGVIPADVAGFTALQDHVDANQYVDEQIGDALAGEDYLTAANAVTALVDAQLAKEAALDGLTSWELSLLHEALEVAVQTDGFIDTTSSGGVTKAQEQAMLAALTDLMHKISGLAAKAAAEGY